MMRMYSVKAGNLLSVEGGLVPQEQAIIMWKRLNAQRNRGKIPFTDPESKLYDALTIHLFHASLITRIETYSTEEKPAE